MTSKEALEKMLDDLISYESYFADGSYYDNKDRFDIVEKDLDLLEEYRKIEEEIGVNFITLIKMLKDGVYINDGGIVDEIGHIYIKIKSSLSSIGQFGGLLLATMSNMHLGIVGRLGR